MITLQLSKGVTIIDFADYIVVAPMVGNIEAIGILTSETIRETASYFENAGLTLTKHKTEMILITKRSKETFIYSQSVLKYHQVMIDRKLDCKSYKTKIRTPYSMKHYA